MSEAYRDPGARLKVSRKAGGEPEIFHSLQGEGATIGTPSVFLRLALCNLMCSYCDTRYTWDWKRYDYQKEVAELPLEELEKYILSYPCRHLVITGGEPLLQQEALSDLTSSLKGRGFTFEVETNGTIAPGPGLARDIDQWNVSPKLGSSGNPVALRDVSTALEAFAALPNVYYKFVIINQSDVGEVDKLILKYQLPRDRVILMPEGRTPAVLEKRSQWLSQVCVDQGFRFTTRLHILLWGDVRGK